ncbi:MAG: carbon monoxide dehydrogenase subunit G [Anaerolineae bacterium]|nr:carbon monoxide dehydrogenase subunit G [Anaerolineae bacterium]
MKLQGEYVFDGPREDVWELVRDPEVLATALPGAQSLSQVSENEYEGTMNVRIGPVAGVFAGRVVVSDEVPPESYTLTVEGKGNPGWAKGSGQVRLVDQGDGTTLMKYEGEVQIGGRLASVGQRLIDSVSKSLIRQGLETLNQALQARIAAGCQGQEVNYCPPSEAEFAAAVAKDMATQAFASSPWLWAVLAALVVIVVVVVVLITRGG